MKLELTESQARHILQPLTDPSEKPSQLQALVIRLLLIPEGGPVHKIRTQAYQPNNRVQIGSVLEAMLPDAIFRAAVLDEGWSVIEAEAIYRAACVIVS